MKHLNEHAVGPKIDNGTLLLFECPHTVSPFHAPSPHISDTDVLFSPITIQKHSYAMSFSTDNNNNYLASAAVVMDQQCPGAPMKTETTRSRLASGRSSINNAARRLFDVDEQ